MSLGALRLFVYPTRTAPKWPEKEAKGLLNKSDAGTVYGLRGSQVTTPAAGHRTPPAQFTGDGGAASGVTPALRRL